MALDTDSRQMVDYFVGTEVENTVMKGERTLFVVGIKPVDEVIALCEQENVRHIYLGTSQCFHPHSPYDWAAWDDLIKPLLVKDYWVTLDFGVEYAKDLHEQSWCEYKTFVPMISVKLPYIKQYNYNATVKLDDLTWGKSNPGVWTHQLHDLMNMKNYTHWAQYTQDEEIK